MHIGLVLSKTPSFSETFFNSKIKGLLASGFLVTLFVQKKNADFNLCKVKVAPKVYRKNYALQLYWFLVWSFRLLGHLNAVIRFIQLEKQAKRQPMQIYKNIYNNAHILTTQVDWIHFGFSTLALQSEFVAKSIGAKLTVSCRGYDLDVYPLKHPNCYQLLWEQVDLVHVISDYMLVQAYRTGMHAGTPYKVIYPMIDLNKITPKTNNSIEHPVRLITIARLHWIKGLTDVLETLEILKHQGLGFEYTLIGDGPEYEALKYATHQLNLQKDVRFMGELNHSDTLKLLSQSDIYVQYSHSEGFCNAVLEAQAVGLLCLVSDVGGLSENVIDGQTGWIVTKKSPSLLAEAILKVLHLPESHIDEIRIKAQKRVQETFNLNLQRSQFEEFYNSI